MQTVRISKENNEKLRLLRLGSASLNDVVGILVECWEKEHPGEIILKQGIKGKPEIVGRNV